MGSVIIKYSDKFKERVISDLSKGNYSSISSACRAYGINKYETVVKWLKKAGREDLLPNIKVIE